MPKGVHTFGSQRQKSSGYYHHNNVSISSHQVKHKSSDPNEQSMASDPGEVVMEGVWGEAAGHEGRVVHAHDRVEQHLLQADVEVRLQGLKHKEDRT